MFLLLGNSWPLSTYQQSFEKGQQARVFGTIKNRVCRELFFAAFLHHRNPCRIMLHNRPSVAFGQKSGHLCLHFVLWMNGAFWIKSHGIYGWFWKGKTEWTKIWRKENGEGRFLIVPSLKNETSLADVGQGL